MKKRMALTALGLGAAYLMRNKDARNKLSSQFDDFAGTSKDSNHRSYTDSRTGTHERKKGLLGSLLG